MSRVVKSSGCEAGENRFLEVLNYFKNTPRGDLMVKRYVYFKAVCMCGTRD